jgi:hypothetical protein
MATSNNRIGTFELRAIYTSSSVTKARVTGLDLDVLYRYFPEGIIRLRQGRAPMAPYQIRTSSVSVTKTTAEHVNLKNRILTIRKKEDEGEI